MELGILDTTHGTYDARRWCQVEALAKGGQAFSEHLFVFLPQNAVEPLDVYIQRRKEAHYRSYMGAIINLYVGWLFASDFSIKPYKRETEDPIANPDAFYGRFQEDVGSETELSDFMQHQFRHALTNQVSAWLVELPSNDGVEPETAKEFETRGLGDATLKHVDREEIYDWQEDDEGNLQWVILHTICQDRNDWQAGRDLFTETWCVYDTTNVYTFQLKYKKNERPTDPKTQVPQISEPQPHGFKRVPLVRMTVPYELCIGEQVFDTQLEHFRQDNALSWLIRRTCYAQPLFMIEDPENAPPRMGTGYSIMLGKEDKMGWTSPPQTPFDVLQKSIDAKRDEIYRIVHQMAQGVDNNAETVGRSADSKEIDAAATRIMLNAYGKFVSKSIEETLEIISEARGDKDYEWSVEGFAGYDTATVSSLIANAKEARRLGIPSATFHKELCTKVAMAMQPETDQRVKDTIRREIHESQFDISSKPLEEAQLDLLGAKADLDRAKAESEPVKAQAAMKTADASMTKAKKPAPKPSPPGGVPKAK